MGTRKRIGLIFSYDEQWMGGTYYIVNLIQSLNFLEDSQKPELVIFSNKKDFEYLQSEVNYPWLEFNLMDENPGSPSLHFLNKISGKLIKKKIFTRRYKGRLDMIFPFQQNNYFKRIPTTKHVYWIPDFQDKNLPQFFTEKDLQKRDTKNKWITENAARLVVSSQAVFSDLVKFYPNYSAKVFIVHFAVTHPQFESLNIIELKSKHQLPDIYFFSPNQFWAHKNQLLVIKAAEELKNQGVNICIAFSGKENDNRNPGYTEMLKQYVIDKRLNDQIKFLGFLDRKEQLQLMNHSIAVIQPSLFEGWSTVIEDAMAIGKQVIASNLAVNQEQLGDLGTYFEKENPQDLAKKLHEELSRNHEIDYKYSQKQKSFANNFMSILDI